MNYENDGSTFFPDSLSQEDGNTLRELAIKVARQCGYDPARVTLQIFCDKSAEVQICLRKARVGV